MNDSTAPASYVPQQIPMTFGQILDRIFRLMRSNLKLFIGIAAVPAVASLLIVAIFFAVALVPIINHLPKQPDPREVLGFMLPAILIMMIVNLVVFALYLAASIHAASQVNLGLRITFREAYATAWKHGGRYLWLLFLAYLIAFVPLLITELVMIVPMALLTSAKTSPPALMYTIPLGIVLFIAACVYGVIMALRLSLAFPASLAEDLAAGAAIRRSGQLTQGAKGRIFLILLVIYALGYAAEMVVAVVLMVLFGVGALVVTALHIKLASVAGVIGAGVATVFILTLFFLWIALFWSAFSTTFAVFYHDQRLRKEGLLPTPPQTGEDQV